MVSNPGRLVALRGLLREAWVGSIVSLLTFSGHVVPGPGVGTLDDSKSSTGLWWFIRLYISMVYLFLVLFFLAIILIFLLLYSDTQQETGHDLPFSSLRLLKMSSASLQKI